MLGVFLTAHFDEREPARPAGRLIPHQVDRFDDAGAGKELLEILLARAEWKIPDKEFTSHVPTFLPAAAGHV